MTRFIPKKEFNLSLFDYYLKEAKYSNQYTNYGACVQTLEQRARIMLGIDNSKAIIATNNGASSLHAMLLAIERLDGVKPIYSQDFTFPCNMQGPASGAFSLDMTADQQIDLNKIDNTKPSIIIVTNCFGHLQELSVLESFAAEHNHILLFDNAATPYSFYKEVNSCNYGVGSYISLHHTKPIGFGEGGLAIIDKKYEKYVRSACNFGIIEGVPSVHGSNFKMSEISAASILQWWDSFNIENLKNKFLTAYNKASKGYNTFSNSTNNFFPNCLPIIFPLSIELSDFQDIDVRKYYKPMYNLINSKKLYERIICFPLIESYK